eukprot:jgi/Tetstr1/430202/TSEL_020032.t2
MQRSKEPCMLQHAASPNPSKLPKKVTPAGLQRVGAALEIAAKAEEKKEQQVNKAEEEVAYAMCRKTKLDEAVAEAEQSVLGPSARAYAVWVAVPAGAVVVVGARRCDVAGTQPANPAGTPAPEGGEQGAREPLPAELDTPDDELEYVDFAYYGRVIPPGLERPPRDVDEPRMWTLTDDTARALAEKRSQAAYDEYLHLDCYAFFSSCANEAMRGALESLSTESATPASKAAALAELRACYRTHLATEEATRSRLGYLQLAKNGPTATDADRVFAELAHAKFYTPRRIAVSEQLDQLRRAFDDKTLEISLSAAGKARAAAAFAKATPDKPAPTESAERRKQREQAVAARKAAATATASDKAKAKVTK